MGLKQEIRIEPLIPAETVAERLCVHINTVYTLVRTGKLKGYKIGHKSLRVTQSSLEAFLGSCECEVFPGYDLPREDEA